jgi:NADPH:quinone reductase-like Zn-dependent oxidoreductase
MTAPKGTTGPATPAENRPGIATPVLRPTMQAVVQTEYGSADVLHLQQVDRPTIGDDEVLLRVHAAGIDRGTWHFMTGQPYAIRLIAGLRRPKNPVLGLDVAGTVVAVGPAVDTFAVGDEVFGIGRGSFAEYAAARADKLARKPTRLTFEQAAAMTVSGLTALQALRTGRARAGQHVLIIGASGGVGTFAVQIAHALGAKVTGVASTTKVDLVGSIGADHVIDYTCDDFAAGSRRYDVILDIGGNAPLSRLRRALTRSGALVIVGGEDGGRWTGVRRQVRALALSPFVRQRLTTFIAAHRRADIEHLAQLVGAGDLTPILDTTYPLAQAADAMRHLVAGRARGKLAITMATG